MDDVVIEVRNLSYAYAGASELSLSCKGHRVSAVDRLSLSVKRGERLAVLGANGSGKSTLLMLLNGTLRPTDGTILINGQPFDTSRSGLSYLRQKVGLVFQDPDDQLFAPTVYQDVAYGPSNLGCNEAKTRRRADEALHLLGIADLAKSPIHMLSGGQKKRAAIAGIMAMRPEVLLLDEPTAGLDAAGLRHLMTFLDRLSACGTTVISAVHDTDLALEWADSVAVLVQGKNARQGIPQEVLLDHELLDAAHLRMPMVLKGFQLATGIRGTTAEAEIPRTIEQLIQLLKSR
jgi:cobalt/nickel transport system ATP-binding protein